MAKKMIKIIDCNYFIFYFVRRFLGKNILFTCVPGIIFLPEIIFLCFSMRVYQEEGGSVSF